MIGDTISHYTILSKIGAGGMGEVFLAEDSRLGRKVALKFLSPELVADRPALARFRNEARAIAELSHPNIATIHDIGETGERPFLVLEYVEGLTLKELIRAAPIDVDKVLEFGLALAAGLAEAHSKEIVHRDVKPANVMVTTAGTPKLLDFGLARKSDNTQVTKAGTTLGTVGYMSPEQLMGGDVDARSDLWSLGVVLYECLTGQHPFNAESSDAIGHRIAYESPRLPGELRRGVPLPLESAIMRCLEKDPAARIQSAHELIAALKAAQSPSHPESIRHETPRRRRPGWIAGAAVAAAIVAAGAYFWVTGSRTPVKAGPPSIAVIGFDTLSGGPDSSMSAGLVSLVQAGLANAVEYRVVSPEYLREVSRDYGEESGGLVMPLDVARRAHASHALTGEVHADEAAPRVIWRIIDSDSGSILKTGIADAGGWSELAATVARDVSDEMLAIAVPESMAGPSPVQLIGTENPLAYRHYSAAMLALALDRRDEAQEDLLKAVELDSTFALAQYELGRSYNPDLDSREAQNALAAALRHQSRLGRKERMLAEAYQHLLKYRVTTAIRAYDEILESWPDSKEALLGRAQTQFFFRQWHPALESATAALRYYPDDPEFMGLRVHSLFQLGEFEESLALEERLQASRGPLLDAPGAKGMLLARLGRIEDAEACFEELREVDPDNPSAAKGPAFCEYSRGNLTNAINMLDEALEEPDLQFEMQVNLLMSWGGLGLKCYLVDAGRFREACDLDREPVQIPAHLRELVTFRDEFMFGHAYREALARTDEDMDPMVEDDRPKEMRLYPYQQLSRIWAALGEVDKAHHAYERAATMIDADPDLPRGFVQRNLHVGADVAIARGDAGEALRLLDDLFEEGFVRMGFDEVMIFESYARAQELDGDLDGSIETLEELTRVYGSRTLAHFQLAQVYEKANRDADARARYENCLRLWVDADSDYPYPDVARARLAALGN